MREAERGPQAEWEGFASVEPVYGIEERPGRWWEALLYGWQHTLVDVSPFVLPLAVAAALDMTLADQAQLINFCLLSMGLATLIQTLLGNRLPIIQGPSATLTGVLTPIAARSGADVMWGGIFAGALVEAAIGASGTLRWLRRLIPPLVAGVVITVIGLSLGGFAIRLFLADRRLQPLALGAGVILLILLLQVWGARRWGGIPARAAIFAAIWLVGIGLGAPLGEVNWQLVAEKPWLQVPRLFPYGGPGFGWQWSSAALLGILAGYFGSMVESIGDYSATCAVSRVPLTSRHIHRGLAAEGLGCLVAACLGGLPCTSYTQNVGIIATTRVASRMVVQIAALILALYGLCPKFGALLVAIPRPVLGGVFIVVCGMIAVTGIQMMGRAMRQSSQGFVVGTTLVLSLGLPQAAQLEPLASRVRELPALLELLATNSIVLAMLLAIGLNALSVAAADTESQ